MTPQRPVVPERGEGKREKERSLSLTTMEEDGEGRCDEYFSKFGRLWIGNNGLACVSTLVFSPNT